MGDKFTSQTTALLARQYSNCSASAYLSTVNIYNENLCHAYLTHAGGGGHTQGE